MIQPAEYAANGTELHLSLSEKQIVGSIRDRIHKNIGHTTSTTAYELSQLLGLVSQIARVNNYEDSGFLQSTLRSFLGKPDIALPREELLQMIETAVIVLTENMDGDQASTKQKLVFARDIRHQVDSQSRHCPNPFMSLFRQYTSLEDRLLSGVVWFFSIFFMLPLSLVIWLLLQPLDENRVNEEILDELTQIAIKYEAMQNGLGQVSNGLDNLISTAASPSTPISTQSGATDQQSSAVASDSLIISRSSLEGLQQIAQGGFDLSTGDTVNTIIPQLQDSIKNDPEAKKEIILEFLTAIGFTREGFFKTDTFLILIAISMGALGSSVSVITSSDKFLSMTKVKKVDPFYIGFFRPFVGMAFAIFVVALLESGVFSSFLTVGTTAGSSTSATRKVYLFAAIAFVAGFSERFAPGLADQVSRTATKEDESTTTDENQRS